MSDILPRPGLIVFDMDGTLIDVTASYRETAPLAAFVYLSLLGLTPPPLTGDIFDIFKRMGGFNDDWDLTTGILEVLVATLPSSLQLPSRQYDDQYALLTDLRTAASPLRRMPVAAPDWDALVTPVRRAGGGLSGLRAITGERNRRLIWHTGDALTTDLVQRIFCEIYLGPERFARCYGFAAVYYTQPGLIELETLLISHATLSALTEIAPLGIATGRTRFETTEALDAYGLRPYFAAVANMTDALEAETATGGTPTGQLLKPHPYLLQRVADTLDPLQPGRVPRLALYVGDSPDDIEAAQRANGVRPWLAVGLSPQGSELRSRHLALGARLVLAHPDELMQAL